jgi:hypothetical protein
MAVMFQTFGGGPIQPASGSYIRIDLDANMQLAWPIQFQNTDSIVFNYMNVVPTGNGFTLTLPDAQDVSVGISTIINNPSAFTFTLNKFDGTLLFSFTPGTARYIILTDNTTAGGTWNNHPFVAGGSAVTSINATSASNNLVIGGVPITSAGTITFAFARDLLELSSFGASVGIACRTGADTWALRTIVGTNNQIAVANEDGVAGDITLSLASDITGVNSIVIDEVRIATNTISTVTTDVDLILDPDGAGVVEIGGAGLRINAGFPIFFYADNDVNYTSIEGGSQAVNVQLVLPTVAPVDGQVLGFVTGTELGWFNVTTFGGPSTIDAIARYSTIDGSLQDSGILISDLAAMTGATSIVAGNILLGGIGGSLPNTIATLNANGNLLIEPNGTGQVLSTADVLIRTAKKLHLYNLANTQSVSLKVPDALAATTEYTLPTTQPGISNIWATSNVGSPSTLINTFMPSNPNLAINGGMTVWQRGTSFTNATVFYPNNDNQYCADGFKILSDGNDIASVTRVAGPNNIAGGSTYAWRFTVTTGAAKFGLCQIFESISTVGLRGDTVVLSFSGAGIGTTSAKMAIIGWTGAADAPTSDPISAWGATGTSPTLVANWAYQSAATVVPLTGNFVTYVTAPITVGPTVNNLALMIWCDATTGVAGNVMDISCVKVEKGPNFTPFSVEDEEVALLRCKRRFQKDFAYTVNPGTATTASTQGSLLVSPINAAIVVPDAARYGTILYENEMSSSTATTVVVYPYTTVTNSARVSDNAGTDLAANSGNVAVSTAKGFSLLNSSGGNLNTTGFFLIHYTASAAEF